MRRTLTLAAAACALAVSACGDDGAPKAAPGSPENPLTAQQPGDTVPAGEPSADTAKASKPGYKALVEEQNAKPRQRFTPCNLVTAHEAQAILGKPMRAPVEAPQGPTCIYRPRDGKALIALAVQDTRFATIKRDIEDLREVAVADRDAYCGTYGQPVLYVPLGDSRLLSVNAECDVARGFAVKALAHL